MKTSIHFDSIAFSGAESTGKTTITDALCKRWNIPSVTNVARTVIKEMGLTYPPVAGDQPLLVQDFQERILQYRITDENNLRLNKQRFISDRVAIDSYAYALACLGANYGSQEWLAQYKQKCIDSIRQYDFIFVLPTGKIDLVSDGTRNVLPMFAEMINHIITNLLQEAKFYPFHIIQSISLNDRLHEVLDTLTTEGLLGDVYASHCVMTSKSFHCVK